MIVIPLLCYPLFTNTTFHAKKTSRNFNEKNIGILMKNEEPVE
jgi:hypothetical protein